MNGWDIVKNNYAVILTAVLYVLMAVRGWKRGLLRMITSLLSIAASVFLAKTVTPFLSGYLSQNIAWKNWFEEKASLLLQGISYEKIMNGISFLILFILFLVLIKILTEGLDKLAGLPVISTVNQVLGAALGIAEATVYLWVAMLFFSVTPDFPVSAEVMRQIAGNQILQELYDSNMILIFLSNIRK